MNGHLLSSIPFLPPCYLLTQLLLENNPLQVITNWIHEFIQKHLQIEKESFSDSISSSQQSFELLVGPQLLAYVIVSIFGYWATDYLIPAIKVSFNSCYYGVVRISMFRLVKCLTFLCRILLL